MGYYAINPSMVPVLWKAIGAKDKNKNGLIEKDKNEGYKEEIEKDIPIGGHKPNGVISPNEAVIHVLYGDKYMTKKVRKSLIKSIIKDLTAKKGKPDFIDNDWESAKGQLASVSYGPKEMDPNNEKLLSRETVVLRAVNMARYLNDKMTEDEKAEILEHLKKIITDDKNGDKLKKEAKQLIERL